MPYLKKEGMNLSTHKISLFLNLFSKCTLYLITNSTEYLPAIPQELFEDERNSVLLYQYAIEKNLIIAISHKGSNQSNPWILFRYKNLLLTSRYTKSCLVHVPLISNPIRSTAGSSYFEELSEKSFTCCRPPDYIIYPKDFTQSPSHCSHKFTQRTYLAPSLIIIVNLTANYVAISDYITKFWDPSARKDYYSIGCLRHQLDKLENSSLKLLQLTWEALLFINFLTTKLFYYKRSCNQMLKPVSIKLKVVLFEEHWLRSCLNGIFLEYKNFSTESIPGFKYDRMKQQLKRNYHSTLILKTIIAPIPNSLDFYGYRYLVMLDTRKIFDTSSIVDLNAVLNPFSPILWALTIFSAVLVALLLRLLGSNSPEFSTLFILIEQDSCAESLSTGKMLTQRFLILTLWVITTYFLRNFYTSNVYSYLTAEPEPIIPSSFENIVKDSSYQILGRDEELWELLVRSDSSQSVGDGTNESLLIKRLISRAKTFPLAFLRETNSWTDFTQYHITQLANGNSISLRCYPFFEHLYNAARENSSLKKIAYLYSYPMAFRPAVESPEFITNSRLDAFSVTSFGSRRVFHNSERLLFSKLEGYKGVYDLRVKVANRIFGELKQSGILSYWKNSFTFVSVAKHLTEINDMIKSNVSWNFVTLAAKMRADARGLKEGIDLGKGKEEKSQIEALGTIWILYGGLCGLCFGPFLVEQIYDSLRSSRV
ncbi:unnamed protein product [Orchesella dallaii]|uniref:Uncharacterized protein n=1 Tax=Orchesella dallaii TaxID=48710 RepID=A0ABP1S7B9_9HEXA